MIAAGMELPNVASLTDEQKQHLLGLLIQDELDRQPIPMPIVVRVNGRDLGQFNPKIVHPTKTTLPPVPAGYWEEMAQYAQNPGKTFTLQEIEALAHSWSTIHRCSRRSPSAYSATMAA